MLSYLRLVVNFNDNGSFLKVINFPPRGIGEKTIEKIKNVAINRNIAFLEALLYVDISNKLKDKLDQFHDMIFRLQLFAKENSLVDLINLIIDIVGFKDYYQKDDDGVSRLENLSQLINVANDFESDLFGLDKVNEFVSFMYLNEISVDDYNKEQKVNLMTIHAAKGLEFDLVFITGLEEGLFPHDNSLSTDNIEEERRLMYVAITRAKNFLHITMASTRLMWGKRNYAIKSRFIGELPNNIIEGINLLSNKFDNVKDSNLNKDIDNSELDLEFNVGDIVKHNKFGNGKIIDIKAHANKLIGDVFFIGIGKKTLDLKIAKIKKV
jgi:DNA helicase-2/ATP-dependent DNA helicase PcrA